MDKTPCLPVKITAKKWADKLQDGSVFMRSLYDFGSWSAIERHNRSDSQMKDGVQGDIGEGIVKTVDPKIGDEFFNSFDPEIRAVMKDMYYIDENFYQYSKIYCMYGLTYLTHEKRFEPPDERLLDFGDTAVIIYNPNEFCTHCTTNTVIILISDVMKFATIRRTITAIWTNFANRQASHGKTSCVSESLCWMVRTLSPTSSGSSESV